MVPNRLAVELCSGCSTVNRIRRAGRQVNHGFRLRVTHEPQHLAGIRDAERVIPHALHGVVRRAFGQIVHPDHVGALIDQSLARMPADETVAPGYQDRHIVPSTNRRDPNTLRPPLHAQVR